MNTAKSLRHALHAAPELSGGETATAEKIITWFKALAPDEILTGLGGTGVAIIFGESGSGPTIMLRSELDALPILETNDMPHRSTTDGISHQCGHDGHMAILAAVGAALAKKRPRNGRVVLLFQPAEETGDGANAVADDAGFAAIRPDRVFALHNLPGYPLGQVVVRDGTFTCASRGIDIRLTGCTAHAAQPETGRSPSRAMREIIALLEGLSDDFDSGGELAFATVVGARLGDRAFGVSPGTAAVWATLRTESDALMQTLVSHCEGRVRDIAKGENLDVDIQYEDVFAATVNAPRAVATIRLACEGLPLVEAARPFRWSEDFGRFTRESEGAFLRWARARTCQRCTMKTTTFLTH
ncbi:MAG: amidohydrolase [Woeseiaceae bacterium]|nr:amidohydrolase [Woeseiaceae bacterium]